MEKEQYNNGVCDQTVFDSTFLSLAPRLRNFLYYRCGDAEQAADLVQESFLKLWENCGKVLPDKAKAWLFRVGENLVFKLGERAKVVRKYEWRQEGLTSVVASPEHQLEEKEFREQLEAAIAGLPEGAREVFLLNRIDGLKYREIAELLNISQKAVEKRMHRALVTLRELHAKI
ncbi:RNA polymerase sigma factor [Neolewinella agarilytica]|nr:sigma-70 family RNA polymerase sigma factor [Neolewinella agarilytica]